MPHHAYRTAPPRLHGLDYTPSPLTPFLPIPPRAFPSLRYLQPYANAPRPPQLSAHQIAMELGPGERLGPPGWYEGGLLALAHDLGKRLLPAFDTPLGIPVHRVNLRKGIPRGRCTGYSLLRCLTVYQHARWPNTTWNDLQQNFFFSSAAGNRCCTVARKNT